MINYTNAPGPEKPQQPEGEPQQPDLDPTQIPDRVNDPKA